MRYLAIAILALLSLGLNTGASAAVDVDINANVNVSGDKDLSFFYEALSPHGRWTEEKDYGWVWQPDVVVENHEWKPYRDEGHWVYTNDGWYWQSEYEWGWAPFHYGRWTTLQDRGWVWVPDVTWAPSWVVFRESGDYYGWAPLPPFVEYEPNVGFNLHGRHIDFNAGLDLNENFYTFVPANRFLEANVATVAIAPREESNIFRSSKVVNNSYTYNDNHVVNNGLPVQQVSRAANREVKPVQVANANSPAATRQANGNQIQAFRPQIKSTKSKDPSAFADRSHSANRNMNDTKSTMERNREADKANDANKTNTANQPAKRNEAQKQNGDQGAVQQHDRNAIHPQNTSADRNERANNANSENLPRSREQRDREQVTPANPQNEGLRSDLQQQQQQRSDAMKNAQERNEAARSNAQRDEALRNEQKAANEQKAQQKNEAQRSQQPSHAPAAPAPAAQERSQNREAPPQHNAPAPSPAHDENELHHQVNTHSQAQPSAEPAKAAENHAAEPAKSEKNDARK